MPRYKGKGTLLTTYNVTDFHPLDTRQLVPVKNDLLDITNWQYTKPDGKIIDISFNGMIVAVGADITENGVYYLFDANNPGEKDVPDVTNPANWHKLCDLSELETLADRVAELEGKNPEINYEELIAQLKEQLVSIETYNKDKEEISGDIDALQTSIQSNTDAIAELSANISEEKISDVAVQAIETKITETDSSYSSIAALVSAVSVAKSHADNAEVKLNALLSDKYYNEPIYLGEIIGNEITEASDSFDADNISETINSIAALTQTTIKNKNDLAALINDLDGAVINGFESLISDRAEFYIETVTVNDPDGSNHTEKRLRINQIELSKIIHTDNTTIVIHGGNASI